MEEAHEERRYGPWMRVRSENGPQQKLFSGSWNSAELPEKDTRIEDRLISTMKDKQIVTSLVSEETPSKSTSDTLHIGPKVSIPLQGISNFPPR